MIKAGMGYLTAVVAMVRPKAMGAALLLGAALPGASHAAQIILSSGTSWTVPSDWNSANNTIEVIGGGGGGGSTTPNVGWGGGGGGGAYSKNSNLALTPGVTVTIAIGAGGGNATGGGDTYLCNSTSNCSGITGTAVQVGAKGGGGGGNASSGAAGAGGAASSGIGSVKTSGGTGGSGGGAANDGGGGAGGPHGSGNPGTSNSGGSGDAGSGGAGGAVGSNGGIGTEWTSTVGSGGGAGRSGGSAPAVGGLYGGGGGGGNDNGSATLPGGSGAQGVIVITYAPASSPPTASLPGTPNATRVYLTNGTSWVVPNNWNSANNSIEVIGGGGGGGNTTPNNLWGGGGGGGAYSRTYNVALSPGATITIAVGSGGGDARTGGDTYLCNSISNCGGITGTAVQVGAKGGQGGTDSASGGAAGAGGASSAGIGAFKTSGGAGGPGGSAANDSGGGAGGPHGTGNNGTANSGGAGDAGFGGASAAAGSNGAVGTEWDSSHGSGSGAGRGSSGVPSPTGGLYGGGGGGGLDNGSSTVSGGTGAPGIIVLTYVPITPPSASSSASLTRTSSFAYDSGSGLLTQEVVEPNTSSLRLETDYVYDAYGNKTSVAVSGVDITTRSSTTTYDARGQFVASNANALGQSESWQNDPRFGAPTSHTGPNGLTTTWSYDTFGRKVQEVRADGTQTKWTYQFCSGVNGGTATCLSGASYLIQSTPYASDGATQNGPTSIVYFDALDREIGRDTQGFDGSTVRATKTYDALGRVSQTSRPYFANSGTVELTTFTYDTLGRVVKVTAPDNSVSQTAYHGLTVTDTNTLNQTRTVIKNSQGKVAAVTDALGNTMNYAYDGVGNLIQTTDAVGNIVIASYDTRGRKTASNDPDLGSWSYSYDTLSELTSQTDAKGQSTTISYDLLSRPLQRVEADMTSVWVYDSAANGIGKLASSSITAGAGAGFQRSLSYDTLGRPIQVATTISGTTYAMGASYDANSRLSTVSYPSGFTAKYSYTNLGFANQLQDTSSGLAYWTANAMDASGHLTQQTAGNGLATTRTFDPTTGRLTSISTGSSGAVQNLSYTYDLLGSPLSRSDANTGLSETLVYDQLNRLTQSTVNLSTPLVKTFSYSAIGNMLSKSDVGTYSYPAAGSALPHAVMSTSGGTISATFTYDANGNQTAGLGRNISYSAHNKPSSITQGTLTISFLDDTEHQRFQQVTPSGTIFYIAGFGVLSELLNPGTSSAQWTDYLAVGNAKVGMRVLQTASETLSTRYFHTDHLGSVSVITDENGNVLERLSYDAWGKRRFPNGSDDPSNSITSQTTRGFTGEEELQTASLVHLNGRVYDSLLARFTSADPTVTDPTNPQGWNRYSYVGNDPLAFTDPNGFSWLSGFFNSVGKFFTGIGNFIKNNSIVRAIIQIGITAILTPLLGPVAIAAGLGTFAAGAAGAAAAFIGSAVVTGISGGNLSQSLRAGLIAGVTAFAFFEVGEFTGHTPAFGTLQYAENVAGHALVGCASSAASGGSCESGALSGAVSASAAPFVSKDFAVATVESAVLGGVASVAGGGKFANGAITGAYGYLFNVVAGGVGRMLDGQDAHRALQDWLQQQGINSLFVEQSTDGLGTLFWGRVDIGIRLENSIWEIKPDNYAGLFDARVLAEFYSITAVGITDYHPGGNDLPLPAEPLVGSRGSYTYINAGDGAILWDPYRAASQGYSLAPAPNGAPFALPPSLYRFLLR